MQIIVGKNAGFCFGVSNAIKMVYDAKKNCNAKVYTLGEIIHNPIVVEQLQKNDIFEVDENFDKQNTHDAIVIRSHGVSKQINEKLLKNWGNVVDATCPFVKKIHDIVQEKFNAGYKIVIIGEPDHAEVIGTNGWCENQAIIISEVNFKFTFLDTEKYCIVSQTTFSYEKYKKIVEIIKNNAKIVEFFNTICYTTKERQLEAQNIAKNVDTMLVLGGKHSSNTCKLFELCKKYCKNTYLIEKVTELKSVQIKNTKRLGITAGASTPNELIEEVVKVMGESQNKDNVVVSNEEIAEKQNNEVKNAMTMDDVMAKMDKSKNVIKAGGKIKGVVISADETGITVSLDGKKDGKIDKAEAEIDEATYDPATYKKGDIVEAIVIENTTKAKDCICLSKKAIDIKKKEQVEAEKILTGDEFKMLVDKAVKGGLIGKVGPYTVFVPSSQIKRGFVNDLDKYVGKTLRLRMLTDKNDETEEKDNKIIGKRVVASQRIILEQEKQDREDLFWGSMQEGTVVSGKVKRFADFGAFVSVNGFDCLAHISDLSWFKIEKASEILEINNTYEFVVLNADRENNRVSLGYKQLQKKPYEIALDKYPIDSIVKGVVERIYPYGAFVTIDKGVDGLVPVSEISYDWIKNASEYFTKGQEIEAKVINFEGNKITLSVKALLPVPEVIETQEPTEEEFNDLKEKRAKANASKFDRKPAKTRKTSKKDEPEEIRQWTSDDGNTSLGDLLKGLNLDLLNNNDVEE
ncbi:MAG: bifunctional 4-hydroxy-3-methylbut-2-enyl diphosphate reductase/30S ribosomal protein S1 [Clostridia bacterium]